MKTNRLRGSAGLIFGALLAISHTQLSLAEEPKPAENVVFLEQWKVPVRELPLIAGSPDAEHWVIVYSKWSCQICGMMYGAWQDVLKDFPGGKVGVVMLPGLSLNSVEPLQKTMLCVWRADPEAYRNVTSMIWGGALPPNQPAQIREALAGFMGGQQSLADAEKQHAQWADAQIALSASMLRHLEKVTGDTGSYPKMTTTSAASMGHLGPNASYRKFLVDQGWATPEWAAGADQADQKAHANPAQEIVQTRKNKAPRRLAQEIDLGKITEAAGSRGKAVTLTAIQSADVANISSSHGSLSATAESTPGPLNIHLTWRKGLGPGAWDTTLLVSEKSGKKHIVIVKGELIP